MAEQTSTGNQTSSNNQLYASGQVIEKRLNTKELLDNCETFLSGKKWIVQEVADDKGGKRLTTTLVQTGHARMNEQGVAAVMNALNMLFNTSLVQGNIDTERWKYEIAEARRSLSKDIMKNLYKWEVSENEFTGIIDYIMICFKLYLSRTIDNKERESYDQTLKVTETSQVQQKGRFSI